MTRLEWQNKGYGKEYDTVTDGEDLSVLRATLGARGAVAE